MCFSLSNDTPVTTFFINTYTLYSFIQTVFVVFENMIKIAEPQTNN